MELLQKYFPELTTLQIERFSKLYHLYSDWNQKINVVSRKDIDELYLRHVVHSLGIAKVQVFQPDSTILDVGTGGGFPGIPLAILFPETHFTLVDSIGKKIKVVEAVSEALQLENVKAAHQRAETIPGNFDFIVSRAVTQMEEFVGWVKDKVAKKSRHDLKNGILYLKGGDLTHELMPFPKATIFELQNYFKEDFFETKRVVHIPLKYKGQ
ncbi:MAG: 16S rRNA (guanine(527)-N(7))-methyltransferase RsmG [Flavobacteriaceae bacterium]|nr:16S rRNA (guanine(527)-N(7))-methyltransferase RsmG [Flavobacteriaceae bacterium]